MTSRANAEREAIEYARDQFHQFQRWPLPRADLSALRRGARALLSALPESGDWDGQLLALMQAHPPHVTQQAVVDELERLRITLQRIDSATTPTRGIRPDTLDREAWILHACDAWLQFTGKRPSDSEGSGFLKALRDYGAGAPRVTRDDLRKMIPRWRAIRGG